MAITILAVLPALVTIYTASLQERKLSEQTSQTRARLMSNVTATELERYIEGARQLLIAISRLPEMQRNNALAANALAQKLHHAYPDYTVIAVANLKGDVIFSSIPLKKPVNVADRPYFKQVLKTQDFSIGNFQIGRIVNEPAIDVAYPIVGGNNKIKRIIFAGISLKWLDKLVQSARTVPGATISIIDRNGVLLARNPGREKVGHIASPALLRIIGANKPPSTYTDVGSDGVRKLYAWEPIYGVRSMGDAYLITSIPVQLAFAAEHRLMLQGMFLWIIGALCAVIIAWWMGDWLVMGQVRRMVRTTAVLATGDFSARTGIPHGDGELDVLANSLDGLAYSLQKMEKERSVAIKALESSEHRYRSMFRDHPAVMLLLDAHTFEIVDANPAAARFYGNSIESLIGMRFTDLMDGTEPGGSLLTNGHLHDTDHFKVTKFRLASGEIREVEIYCGAVTLNEKEMIYAIVHDITEKHRLEEQLAQTQKLESIGKLAGGIAHDFNNLLTVIIGYADMMEDEIKDLTILHAVQQVKKAAFRAADLTRQLLAFARRQMIAPRVVDLNALIEDIREFLQRLLGEDVVLEVNPQENLWQVKVDPGQIEQVIFNLAANGRDAMPGGGELVISTRNRILADEERSEFPDLMQGEYVELSVKDDGVGMSEDMISRIFEPFYTTKEQGKGTGMGLASCYGIIRQNHGAIRVRSAIGEGSVFSILLPAIHETPSEIRKVEHEKPQGKEALILLVEDDEQVLDISRNILVNNGYKVITSRNSREALKIAFDNADRLTMLITDIIMPEMNGKELVKRVHEFVPKLPVMYISGYSFSALEGEGFTDSGEVILQKPYSADEFVKTMQTILNP
jgi:two-component system cell cycle sensor histidine kinase/response regulator CckA